jgi:hypothetical protein
MDVVGISTVVAMIASLCPEVLFGTEVSVSLSTV